MGLNSLNYRFNKNNVDKFANITYTINSDTLTIR
jgi:hypothetical protein